jgi:Ca-activated chloride channel family protein
VWHASIAAGISVVVLGGVVAALALWPGWRPSLADLPEPVTGSLNVEVPRTPPRTIEVPRTPGYSTYDGLDAGVPGGVPGGVEGGVLGGVVGGTGDAPSFALYAHPSGPSDRALLFERQGTNAFVETRDDPLSTFGLDVDTASYTLARDFINRGALPPPAAVRVEEFVNALPQADPPEPDQTLTLHLEAAPNPLHPGYDILRIGVRARDVARRDRKPAVLTFVIDVSGSMAMENRLGLVKRSLRLLVERLDGSDRIGLVVYGTNGRVVLDPTPVSASEEILEAIDGLAPEGATNLEEGLDLGYRMASDARDPAAANRVILCTDGVANNGVTDAETLLRRIRRHADRGIAMTALGFGMGNYNDALLQKLADRGDGQYAYIDSFIEAKRFFLRDLTGVLELVAKDAKAQVEFDPAGIERYRLIGYEKRDIADQDFRDDTVDGGELNAGHAVTVLYEVKRTGGAPLGAVRVRYLDPETGEPVEVERVIDEGVFRERFEEATPRLRLAFVAARFAEHLRGSEWVKAEPLDAVQRLAEGLPPELFRDAAVSELIGLVRRAVALDRRQPRE